MYKKEFLNIDINIHDYKPHLILKRLALSMFLNNWLMPHDGVGYIMQYYPKHKLSPAGRNNNAKLSIVHASMQMQGVQCKYEFSYSVAFSLSLSATGGKQTISVLLCLNCIRQDKRFTRL